ncbi:MAG: hypothetical protein IMW89_09925 [Ktedonobacteraceae bacterium]|nr:hypothetical protein [Ktedonobacteraceae bacterium]
MMNCAVERISARAARCLLALLAHRRIFLFACLPVVQQFKERRSPQRDLLKERGVADQCVQATTNFKDQPGIQGYIAYGETMLERPKHHKAIGQSCPTPLSSDQKSTLPVPCRRTACISLNAVMNSEHQLRRKWSARPYL